MPVNVDKMNEERAKRNAGGELWDVPEGENRIYVCAFPRPTDDVCYAEFRMHYSVGPKANMSHMCLEPSLNKIILLDEFQEQLVLLKKETGPCETCERLDRGEAVSGNPDESGKSQSRWLWLVVPFGHRTDARQQWQPPKAKEVIGLSSPYRVWDGLMDQFGQCGDITDMDAAILPRLIREGTKGTTKWDIQGDVESIRKPIKLDKALREHILEKTSPGATFDPMRILAGMLKTPADIAKIHAVQQKSDEYEEPGGEGTEQTEQPASNFKPPGKKTASAPAAKPAAASTKQAPVASGTKAPAPKPEPKPTSKPATAASPQAKANNQLKALVAKHGQTPGCYQVDPDPGAEICIKCPFQELCFNFCGVALPEAQPEPEAEPEATEQTEEPAGMTVEQCVPGETYVVNGVTGTFKGPAKGKFYFAGEDGKAFAVEAGTAVDAPSDEAPAEAAAEEASDDAALQEMEAALAARKAAKNKAPAKK